VLKALPSRYNKRAQASNFLDSSIPVRVRQEIQITVRCAMIAAVLDAETARGKPLLPASLTLQSAMAWFNQIPLDPVDLTLLGFAATYHLLNTLKECSNLLSPSSSSDSLSSLSTKASDSTSPATTPKQKLVKPLPEYGRVAGDLVYWARHAYNPSFYGLTPELVDSVEDECVAVCKHFGVDLYKPKSTRKALSRKKNKQRKKIAASKKEISENVSVSVSSSPSASAPALASGPVSGSTKPNFKVPVAVAVKSTQRQNDNGIRRISLESNDPGYGSLDGNFDG